MTAPAVLCRAAGVTFMEGYPRNLADLVERFAVEGPLPVDLDRDLDNGADINALAITFEGRRLGFVPTDIAAEIAPRIDAGRPWRGYALFVAVDLDHRARPGLQLLLMEGITA